MELSPAETVAVLFTLLLTLFAPVLGLLVVVVMFVVGMIQGGNWMFARATGIGFLIGLLLYYVVVVLLSVSLL